MFHNEDHSGNTNNNCKRDRSLPYRFGSNAFRILISEYNYEEINTSDVKKGMILSMSDTMLFVNSKSKDFQCYQPKTLRSRLTDEEANSVVKWGKFQTWKENC